MILNKNRITPLLGVILLALTGCGVSINSNATIPTMLLAQMVPPEATGSIDFYSDNIKIGTVTIKAGQAAMTARLKQGSHSLRADYISSNTKAFNNSSDTITFDVELPSTLVIFNEGVNPHFYNL